MHGSKVFKVIGWVIVGICGAGLLGLLLGFVVMWLWNWLMPAIFGLPLIGYWKAVGLFLLCHLLFKGHPGHKGDRHDDHGARFRSRVKRFMKSDADADAPAGGEPGATGPASAC